jgi:two-component system chemotaxis response regulator CheY
MNRRGLVLVVEDDADVREAVIEALADAGFETVGVANGAEALTALRCAVSLPDVILLDLMMPRLNGFAFRFEQRSDPSLASIPVVICSADPSVEAQAFDLGAAWAIRKPFKLRALVEVIERCIPPALHEP